MSPPESAATNVLVSFQPARPSDICLMLLASQAAARGIAIRTPEPGPHMRAVGQRALVTIHFMDASGSHPLACLVLGVRRLDRLFAASIYVPCMEPVSDFWPYQKTVARWSWQHVEPYSANLGMLQPVHQLSLARALEMRCGRHALLTNTVSQENI